MKQKKIYFFLLISVSLLAIRCSPFNVENDLKKLLDLELDSLVRAIKDTSYLFKPKPFYQIKVFKQVAGTYITYVSMVDFFYLDTSKIPVFYRRVYRYIEPKKRWEVHRYFLLNISYLADTNYTRYLKNSF